MQFFPLKARTVTYELAHWLSQFYFTKILGGEVQGIENVPMDGPALIAGNHLSFIDPPMFGCVIPRESYYFARDSLFKPGFAEKRLHELNAIPVRRDDDSDVSALKRTLRILKDGNLLIYFPEGTRSLTGNLQSAKAGVGLVACKTAVPVVPARIFNSHLIRGGKNNTKSMEYPLSIVFGKKLEPADYDPGASASNRYQEAANRIMHAIATLQPVRSPSV